MTLDELIERLRLLKHLHGGDRPVYVGGGNGVLARYEQVAAADNHASSSAVILSLQSQV